MGSALLIVVLAVAAFLALLWVSQRRLIYLPSTAPLPPARSFILDAEDVAFRTEDGLRLQGWFVPCEVAGPAVLLLNGNAGDRSIRAPLAERIASAGLSVLLFDYRGYGGNPGSPSEDGLMADARAARDYLESRDDVDPARVVILGESLGAAVGVGLAAERPPAALVLRSPFTSLAEIASVHFPLLPVRWMLRDRYPSIDRIPRVACPVMVVAGDADTVVPAGHSRSLYEAAAEPKRLVMIPGADHNDFDFCEGERWIDEMLRFLDETGVLARGDRARSGLDG